MALDEPKSTDERFEIDGFEYIIDKELMEKAKPIKIDFQGMGFKLDCGLDFSASPGCAGCGSSCG
ncbi:MAG: hypothetical protein R6U50_09560 [Desulfobacterales bacterium]